jgi:hypothetical protein
LSLFTYPVQEVLLSFSTVVSNSLIVVLFDTHTRFFFNMLFINSATILTLALGVVAKSTIVARDEASITKVIKDVIALTTNLDQIVKTFSGDPQPLQDASSKLLAGISDAVTTVQASGSLDMDASAQVGIPTIDLNTTVAITVTDLISKKQAFVQAGQGAVVYKSLLDQKAAADQLSKAIISKLHKDVQDIGVTLSSGIIISLQQGLDSFKDAANAPVPTAPAAVVPPTAPVPTSSTEAVIVVPVGPSTVNVTTVTKAHTKSTGGYDTPTTPSKTASHGYDVSSSSISAPGYGYNTPSAPASKPTKSAPGYGYDTPSAPAAKPTSAPGYGYNSPPAYDSPTGAPPAASKSKTRAPVPVSTTKVASPAVFTAGAALNGVSGGLAVLAAAVMVL